MLLKTESLKKKTYIALIWSFIDKAGDLIIRFVFSMVLARLLLPEQFGLVGMAYVVIEISRIFVQGGFGYALINKVDAKKIDECSVFYFNIALSIVMVIIIQLIAPFVAAFFKAPALTPIVRVISFDVLIGSFGMIQMVLMTKSINFKRQTKVSLPSTLVSGIIGIILAYCNFGVWALVFQALLRTVLNTTLLWLVHAWRPEYLFSFKSLKLLFRFGSKLMLGNIAQVVFNNIYTILIGRFFSPAQLGYFSRAQQTQNLPVDTLSSVIWRVAFPVFSSMKKDAARMREMLSRASETIAFFVFPSLIVGAAVAKNLFVILFGEKWGLSIPMFQILCLGAIFTPLEQIRNNAITSKGKPGIQLMLQTVRYASILLSVIFLYKFGIIILLFGFGVVSYCNFILNAVMTQRVIGYSIFKQIKDIFPVLVCSLAAGCAAFFIMKLHIKEMAIMLGVQLVCALALYSFLCYLFKIRAMIEYSTLVLRFLPSLPFVHKKM